MLLAITIKETIVRVYQDIRDELFIKYTWLMNLLVILGVSFLPLLPPLTRTAWRTFWSTHSLAVESYSSLSLLRMLEISQRLQVGFIQTVITWLWLPRNHVLNSYSRAQCESKVPVTNGLLEFPVQYDPSLDVYCSGKSWLQIESWEV